MDNFSERKGTAFFSNYKIFSKKMYKIDSTCKVIIFFIKLLGFNILFKNNYYFKGIGLIILHLFITIPPQILLIWGRALILEQNF
jgi:hypothetical protein